MPLPRIFISTIHITIGKKNAPDIRKIIDKLAGLAVPSVSLSMDSKEWSGLTSTTQQYIQQKGINLVWDLPVPYSSNHPVALELSENDEYVSGSGKAWLYVEPDGDVLPDQDDEQILGNFLTDPWDRIWNQR